MYARPSTWIVLGIALLALGFEFVAVPVSHELADARAEAAQARQDYRWMRANVNSAIATSATTSGTSKPLQSLEAALVRAGVRDATERIERQGDTIVFTLRDADFGGVVRWLALAEQELGLPADSFRLAPGTGTGTVSGAVVIASDK